MKKRQGSAYVIVIAVFVFVSLFLTLMVNSLNQSIYQVANTGLQTKCYYLNKQAAEATVAALLADDNYLLKNLTSARSDILEFDDGCKSEIVLTKEYHNYYGDNSVWIVGRITTTIDDFRAGREGETYTYQGTVMVLQDNPLIQLFNLNPEDF